MKKITRRSFMAAAGLTVAALALTACGGSSSTASSAAASSVASSAAASSEAASAAATELTTVEAGKLTMATNAAFPPYEMTTDAGEFEGIDIETAQAIADKLGLELQIDDMDFDAALLSVQQGKADIVMAGVTVTDERKAVMDFSDSYATGIQSIIVPIFLPARSSGEANIDKAHIHNHVIWNSTALCQTRKFRNFWGSSRAVRLLSHGLMI